MITGVGMIQAERDRQRDVEKWSPAHDDQHKHGELADAASLYAMTDRLLNTRMDLFSDWPFELEWWKRCKHSRIKQLAIAGALIAAEIDRLNRKAPDA